MVFGGLISHPFVWYFPSPPSRDSQVLRGHFFLRVGVSGGVRHASAVQARLQRGEGAVFFFNTFDDDGPIYNPPG